MWCTYIVYFINKKSTTHQLYFMIYWLVVTCSLKTPDLDRGLLEWWKDGGIWIQVDLGVSSLMVLSNSFATVNSNNNILF